MKTKAEIGVMLLQPRMPEVASKPPAARGGAWSGFSLPASEGSGLLRHLDLGLPASRAVGQYVSVV